MDICVGFRVRAVTAWLCGAVGGDCRGMAHKLLPVCYLINFILLLTKYFHCTRDNLTSVEKCQLWDIWYTGNTPFPSEVHDLPASQWYSINNLPLD